MKYNKEDVIKSLIRKGARLAKKEVAFGLMQREILLIPRNSLGIKSLGKLDYLKMLGVKWSWS